MNQHFVAAVMRFGRHSLAFGESGNTATEIAEGIATPGFRCAGDTQNHQ